ncbi:MAG: copper chaperone PCu(A)C, partial [Pseudomonadota bacterium]
RVTLQSRPAAGYMSIVNAGDATDRLISAASPKFERIELHTMVEDEGVMRMRALEAIEAPAGGEVMLEPGGMHLMLFGATEAFKVGDEFPVTLTFEKAGPVEVVLHVEKPGHGEVDHSNHGSHSGQTN